MRKRMQMMIWKFWTLTWMIKISDLRGCGVCRSLFLDMDIVVLQNRCENGNIRKLGGIYL